MDYSIDKKIYVINIFILLLFSATIIFLLYTNLHNQKIAVIIDAQNETATLTKFISSDVDRLLFGVEELMEGIHNVEEHIYSDLKHNENIEDLLRNSLRPHIMDILIVDKNSKIIHWTAEGKKPDITDREYINYHLKQTKSEKVFLGDPKYSKVHDKKWFFAMSKAYYKNSVFSHIIVMVLDVEFFSKRYKDNLINKNTTIVLGAKSGKLYTRYPDSKKFTGTELKNIKVFAKSGLSKQDLDMVSTLDNKNRIATLIKSNNYQIYTGVSLLKKDVLKPWIDQKTTTYLITLIVTFGFIGLITYYTRLQNKLINLSQVDNLTQIYNRGYFEKKSLFEFNRAKRFGEDLCVLMIDIDDFKKVNDNYGHQNGDLVIKKLANDLTDSIRNIDYACRYGGEEFIVLLTKTKEQDALIVANRIKDSFEKNSLIKGLKTTVSIGISGIKKNDKSLEASIFRADKALYTSKHNGKNCCTIF